VKISALLVTALVFGATPASAIVADAPPAMAAQFAQEPPPGPQLSAEEQEALDAKKAGTLKKSQEKALNSAERKQQTQEKFDGDRNRQKRDNNRRGGGRRR
jgi:Skp family chaperone for outer membrane proteins